MDGHHSSSPVSPSDTPPQAISRYPSSSGLSHALDNSSSSGSGSTPNNGYRPPFNSNPSSSGAAAAPLHHPIPSSTMSLPRIANMHQLPHPYSQHGGPSHPHHNHPDHHSHGSYIPGILPPGANPHEVDFRNFSAYIPNEVKHRKRTTRTQLRQLEDTFRINEKPAQNVRQKLAEELNMTPRAVQVWFQNRRAKKKNQIKRADKDGLKAEGADDLDELDPTESPSSRSLDGRGSATPPPSSTQPSPLDSIRPHGLFPSDFHELRRGSLPISSLHTIVPPSASQMTTPVLQMSPVGLSPPDPAGRRRSVDASLHRLAQHPYAHVARQANGLYYGPRASVANGQVAAGFAQNVALAATHGPQAVPAGAMSGTYYDYSGGPQRPGLAAHHYASAPYGSEHFAPGGQRVISAGNGVVRSRLHEYVVPERMVPQPGPGPLPSPTYTFGSGSVPEGVQSSGSNGDISQLQAFTFPPRENTSSSTDDSGSSAFVMPSDTATSVLANNNSASASATMGMGPPFDYAARYNQRFGSIAESEASFYSVASAGGSTPPSQNPSEVDLLRRASVASVHDAAWAPSYDGRKDSSASVDTAFLNLAMHRGSQEDLASYYASGVAPNQQAPSQGQEYDPNHNGTSNIAGLPSASDYALQTATQAGFDEAAIAASRRASLAVPQQQAGSGIGSVEVSALHGMGMWASAPEPHSAYGMAALAASQANSRRPSVDASALMGMQQQQQQYVQQQPVLSYAQAQAQGYAGALAVAPALAASPPDTMRSSSVGSGAGHTPPGTGMGTSAAGAGSTSMFREGVNPFGSVLGAGASSVDPLGVLDPATFGMGFPAVTATGVQDAGMYYAGVDMSAMGMGVGMNMNMPMAGEYMQVPVPAYT